MTASMETSNGNTYGEKNDTSRHNMTFGTHTVKSVGAVYTSHIYTLRRSRRNCFACVEFICVFCLCDHLPKWIGAVGRQISGSASNERAKNNKQWERKRKRKRIKRRIDEKMCKNGKWIEWAKGANEREICEHEKCSLNISLNTFRYRLSAKPHLSNTMICFCSICFVLKRQSHLLHEVCVRIWGKLTAFFGLFIRCQSCFRGKKPFLFKFVYWNINEMNFFFFFFKYFIVYLSNL